MTPQTQVIATPGSWQSQLREVVTCGEELLRLLDLQPDAVGLSTAAARDFPLKVPHAFVRRMRRGDPRDPLLRQVLASGEEMLAVPGFGDDPVGETGAANQRPGVVSKYHGRALLIVSGGCAVNCRYCFRRHFPYADNRVARGDWDDALAALARDPDIHEIILSGGDPLVAGDRQLGELVDAIARMPGVRRLRVHSRLPVVIPDRVSDALLQAITRPGLDTVMVIHANHAREIDADVAAANTRLRQAGITVLNQSVLLAGVNDTADALVELSEALFAAGALPYYLHLLDRVRGAAHFEVGESQARTLHREMSARLPGYLVPKLVREIAGAPGKTVLAG
ncbi:EF-P beta-lysylation protein EpmB [Mangrovimicrobium sediminis]|uniref:L-lysine 2,3-aminomutase n=1 Tax=Mangrovimicrobium sediminis TaxID=2562682 RepID=A0A4Z0M0M6_9GAMM|nr:EF-P beta-lysylation protein EpmB [Haliea sp. SAOS-164]TGD72987.1 EF-P beta-lysylation protein EpmB [Haliea sp. SAOS-164]